MLKTFKPSATMLTTGILLAGVGWLLTTLATPGAIRLVLEGGSGINALMVVGGLLGVLGVVCTIIGVYRLATNVDAAAWQTRPTTPAKQSQSEIRARIDEIREQQRSPKPGAGSD
jgi:hypothetical protein